MTNIIIKQCGRPGCDTKIFRAYAPALQLGRSDEPLGISASTTGNSEYGALRCAAKAFKRYSTPEAAHEVDEIETRIKLEVILETPAIWKAILIA